MTSITCGKCHTTHTSVSAVRDCYTARRPSENSTSLGTFQARPETGSLSSALNRELAGLRATVPAGRYAVEWGNVLKFYAVDKPATGPWKGHTFLSVQASDERWPVRAPGLVWAILSVIAKDPKAASLRYGREIGRCGVCDRTLTDAASIERGIGPVCAARTGW